MKKTAGVFIVLLFLFSACGTSVVTVTAPATQEVQRTQTPGPIIALTPSLRPTSTLDEFNQEYKDQYGWFRFCQVEPKSAWLGSAVNVSVFGMPANDLVTIYLYGYQEMANRVVTDSNGYVNADITIPADVNPGTHMIVVDGTGATTDCFVSLWSEEYLPTYYTGLTKTVTPTLSIDQFAITATQQALHNKLDEYCIYQDQARGFRFSPNGQWVEVFCGTDTLEIVRLDETQIWEVSSDTLINPYTEYFGGVNHWSNDGAYAYIDFDPHTDGYWEPFHQGIVLYRLNLETGQISEVLPLGKSDWIFYSFAFSPNDRRLAYIVTDKSPVILNLRDMQTGDEQSFEFDPKYNTGGGFVWSQDSKKLVFSVSRYLGNDDFITSIFLWDKDTSKITELTTDYQGELRATEWVDETKITLDAVVLEQGQLKTRKYELDLTNNELIELNP